MGAEMMSELREIAVSHVSLHRWENRSMSVRCQPSSLRLSGGSLPMDNLDWRLGRAASEDENWTLLAFYNPEERTTRFQLRQLF